MGEVYLHHITMLVSEEQEDAIRFLFKTNQWKCWMKALLEETVTQVMENGFAEIFADSCDNIDDVDDYRSTNKKIVEHNDDDLILDDNLNNETNTDDDDESLVALDSAADDKNEDHDLADCEPEQHVYKKTPIRVSSRNRSTKDKQISKTLNGKVKCKEKVIDKAKRKEKTFVKSKRKVKQIGKRKGTEKTLNKMKNKEQTADKVIRFDKQLTGSVRQKDEVSANEDDNFNDQDEDKVTDKDKGKVKCSFCDMYIVNKYILKRHCQRRHKDVWFEFECKDCPSVFKTKEELWKHRNEVNHKPPENNPKREQKQHHTPEELAGMGHVKCTVCDQYYPNNRLLRRHLYTVHRDLLPKWNCAVCSTEFETRDELWAHKRETKHSTSIWTLGHYQCDTCGKIYNRYDSFRLHKQVACNKEEKEIEELKVHPCDICGLSFKARHHVIAHKRSVHLNAPEMCHICGTVCKNKRALLSHQKRHDLTNRKYRCDDCGKSFFSSNILKQHIRTHTKERPFKCPMCPYITAVKQNIHKHSLKVHKVQAQAIDLRKVKDKEIPSEESIVIVQNTVDEEENHSKNVDNTLTFNDNQFHENMNGVNMNGAACSVPEEDKMMMKIPPASVSNMMMPAPGTSYLEMMNYSVIPNDYNVQPNVQVEHLQFQY